MFRYIYKAATAVAGIGGVLMGAGAMAAVSPVPFTIAVLPDTQNYVDYSHQRASSFPFDAQEMLYDQLQFVRRHLRSSGGDIAFVTAEGDIWQHTSIAIDPDHVRMGFQADPANPFVKRHAADEHTRSVEMPIARRAFELLKGMTPFSVVPGNHDVDAFWADPRFPADKPPYNPYGLGHYGGYDNFRSVFGAASPFFAGQSWYVASFNGGASSAQVFTAGGYSFLHLGLEMQPYDDVLVWAEKVLARYKGLPTIVTIHDHINTSGEREPGFQRLLHPEHNGAPELWAKFLSKNDQIFLVLSGHHPGQSRRVDRNDRGHQVWQILADYQSRQQSLRDIDPTRKVDGIGDGWLRLMTFDLAGGVPKLSVRTYSTYYNSYSSDLPKYAQWYKASEHPNMTDQEFLAEDDFTLSLDDFVARFGRPRSGA